MKDWQPSEFTRLVCFDSPTRNALKSIVREALGELPSPSDKDSTIGHILAAQDDYRHKYETAVVGWERCSATCAQMQDERDAARRECARLRSAIQDEIDILCRRLDDDPGWTCFDRGACSARSDVIETLENILRGPEPYTNGETK